MLLDWNLRVFQASLFRACGDAVTRNSWQPDQSIAMGDAQQRRVNFRAF
jgi:hypothetical protein